MRVRKLNENQEPFSEVNVTNFSIAHDQADIIPLVPQARQLNPQLTIMASPWSPPGWMKTNGSLIGGSLLPSMYAPFARYFVKYIQAYPAAGIPIRYVSLRNEPLFVPGDYPGMFMDAASLTLMTATNPTSPVTWTPATSTAVLSDNPWRVTLPVAPNGSRFYRLQSP